MRDRTRLSSLSILFCISSGELEAVWFSEFFFRVPGCAYVQEDASPLLTQFSHGFERLHFSLITSNNVRAGAKKLQNMENDKYNYSLPLPAGCARKRHPVPFPDHSELAFRRMGSAGR